MAAPVTSFPASPASHTIRLATEVGCTHCDVSAPGISLRLARVSMVPGRMIFAVMPATLFSMATVRISKTNAAFDALIKTFLRFDVTFGPLVDTYYDSIIPRPKAQMFRASLEIE
jgi:hypothetical protein